jgi:dCTP deaminase
MMLSDKELKELSVHNDLISPYKEGNCAGATIDITLSNKIKAYNSEEPIILGSEISEERYKEIDISESEFNLKPSCSILVKSEEYFKIPPNMASIILERYSVKLLGLSVSPASYMNPGYEGNMSFVATNLSSVPIRLTPGIKFAQIALFKLSSEAEKPYIKQDCKYLGEQKVSTSKLHLDKEIQQFLRDKGINYVSHESAKELGSFLMAQIRESAKEIADILRTKRPGEPKV